MEDKVTQEARSAPIDWPATFAGAAAAVTVAVLLSTLGAAGTLIGAALGSVVATVSTALYKQGIESSRRRVAEVQATALQKVNLADRDLRRAEGRPDLPEPTLEVPEVPRSRWKDLPWRRIALFTAGVFVAALLVISIIELIAGRSVSSITGGTDGKDRTSITGVFKDDGSTDDGRDQQTDLPTDEATEPTSETTTETSATPSESSSTPTDTASPTSTDTPTDVTTTPTTDPTEASTDAPTPTP